jgi:perosamine synthetase
VSSSLNEPAIQVPIARASLTEQEINSVLEPLRAGWLVQGPRVREFEDAWSSFTSAPHSIAVTSCTSALHLSLLALGIGPGDEVIVPAFTWISTANVVERVGATVVFVDIDLTTFNLDVSQVEDRITARTRAMMPVHLFGLAADMNPLMAIAEQHGLRVVEDAACGFGSTYFGKHVGTFGDTGSFSFHPRKAITTGEGGMITTRDETLAAKVQRLRDHGAEITDLQRHLGPKPYLLPDFTEAGLNQRMTDIQAALGSAQMMRAGQIVAERRSLADNYDIAFADLHWLQTPPRLEGYGHSYQSYACLFMPEEAHRAARDRDVGTIQRINRERNSWMEKLHVAGVATRPATHAVHMLDYYKVKYSLTPDSFPAAYVANECSISLPLFHGIEEHEQQHVIDVVSGGLA